MNNDELAFSKKKVQEMHVKERVFNFSMNGLDIDVMWIAHVPDERIWRYEKHKDTGFDFHIIPKGKCSVMIEDQEPQEVSAGQLFIVPPGVYHAQQSYQTNPAIEYGLNCHISVNYDQMSDQAEEAYFIEHLRNLKKVWFVNDIFRVVDTFESLFREEKQQLFGYHSHMKALIYTIIINSIRAVAVSIGSESTLHKPDLNEIRMKKIDKIINDHLEKNLTLQDLSNIMFLSERQINRVVLKAHGQTFRQYLLDIKLQKARAWLSDPGLKVYEIAEKLGFYNSHHFSQAFKKKHGFLPSEMKRILEENKLTE